LIWQHCGNKSISSGRKLDLHGPFAEVLLSWLRGERGERGARDAASYHRSRQYRRHIPEIKYVAQDAGDALNAVP